MWWIKVRRVPTVLIPALLLFSLLVVLVQDTLAVLPSFLAGTQHAALMLFVPIPLVSGVMLSLDSRLHASEMSGTRNVKLMDASLVVAATFTSVIVAAAVGEFLDSPQATTVGRNFAFLIGLTLCARAVAGRAAIAAPVAWLMVVMFFGFRVGNDPYPWTLLPEPAGALHALMGAVAMFTVGIVALFFEVRTQE